MLSFDAGVKLLCFVALTAVQVSVAVIYKVSQTNGGYAYSPASALTTSEFIKLCMSLLGVVWGAAMSITPPHTGVRPIGDQYALVGQTTEDDERLATPTKTAAAVPDDPDLEAPVVARARTKTVGCSARAVSLAMAQLRRDLSPSLLFHVTCLASLYAINNHLAFVLFLYVDAASISLFKSWSTAFSALMLWQFFARPIHRLQWASIALQVVGLIIVQYDPCKQGTAHAVSSYMLLLVSVLITSLCSVWNEQVIKRYSASLHSQNAALYAVGTVLNLLVFLFAPPNYPAIGKDPVTGEAVSFFAGYTLVTLGVIGCNSVLGIVITAVYKYADAIIKTFASASATGVLLFVNTVLFAMSASIVMYMGTAVVFIASYIYLTAGALPAEVLTSLTAEVAKFKAAEVAGSPSNGARKAMG